MKRLTGLLAVAFVLFTAMFSWADSAPAPTAPAKVLTTFDFNLVGVGLKAAPSYQAVPKGIASQVNTSLDTGSFNVADIIAQLPQDYTVRAELSGPAFQTPLPLVTKPGQPFSLPSLAILGKYTLSNIRLVDGSGNTLFGAAPQAVAVESISDPLITSVTTRPLTLQEIKDRGVTFDSSNFTAYQFTAGIATSSGQVPLTLPVVIPTSAVVNDPPAGASAIPVIDLPPAPSVPPQVQLPQNLTVSPFLMEVQEKDVAANLSLPPIPGIVVIPGNIGFLHQYFSALAVVTNGAPLQSGLVIKDIQAKIILPSGDDLTPGTDDNPGDDPLRMAKGASGFFPRTMPVMAAGPDGKNGTADDVSLLNPAESGQADFTIEGLKEGTHKLNFEITATLVGLPVGPLTLKGTASGAVLVRNPDFAITLGHPSTVRSGDQYDLFVTVTNTGKSAANLLTVSLDPRALSGAVFAAGETPDKGIDSIPAGSAATVKYRLVSQRTGAVTATAFESPDVQGRFILRAGVDDLNIPLSPDSLILPYTGSIPADLLNSSMALLGQAWSVATAPAGALPSTVLPISKDVVSARAFSLSEAGLRMVLGDTQGKAIEDFSFDFLGSDNADNGFDSLRRQSAQGGALDSALGALFQQEVQASGLFAFQQQFADKVSYRPGHISVVTSSAAVNARLTDPAGNRAGGLSRGESFREIPYGDQLPLSDDGQVKSTLTLVTALSAGNYRLQLSADSDASFDLGVVVPDAAGVLQQLRFSGVHLSAGGKGTLVLHPNASGDYLLAIDNDGDGIADASLSPSSVIPIPAHAPQVVAATQIVPGFGPGGDKHGRNVAVLFSGRVGSESAQNLANYAVDQNQVSQVSLQPGSRMAFLLLRDGIGPFFDRNITISGIADNAGNQMQAPDSRKIVTTAKGPAAVVTGAVRSANGAPVPNATIRLYQLIWYMDPLTGVLEIRSALFSEKSTVADGSYQFDYVFQNDDPQGPFMLEGVNPQTGEVGDLTTGVMYNGQRLNLDILMKARGNVAGTVRDSSGTPVAGASVQISTLNDGRSLTTTCDGAGAFSFSGVSVGAFSLHAVQQTRMLDGRVMGTLPDNGGSVTQDVVALPVGSAATGNVTGRVLAPDGVTPRGGLLVILDAPNYRNWMRSGADGSFLFAGVYTGAATVTVRDDLSGEQSTVTGTVANGANTVLNVIMGGTGTVTGQVARGDGKSPAGLYVYAAVNQITRVVQADASGAFSFSGLSTGQVRIYVADPSDLSRSIASGTVTLLSAGATANIYLYVPGQAFASGTIQGTVYRRDGTPMANAEVRQLSGYLSYYTYHADANGAYSIPSLPLGTYQLVAISGNQVANATATLWYDGQLKSQDLNCVGLGTVTGVTYDDAAKTLPTGADVTLVSTKPNEVGWLVYEGRFPNVVKSDPQTGRYSFSGIYAGSFTVSSSNIFRPTPVSAGGVITANNQTVSVDLALKGSVSTGGQPVNQMGSISGQVYNPDGTPAGAGVSVTVTFGGADVTVTTDGSGHFQFSPIIPSGNQRVRAFDPTTLTWQGYVSVPAGLDVPISIKLLGRGSITVRALTATGAPAPGTAIAVNGSAYPNDGASGTTDANGLITFANLSEGSYAVSASGSFGLGGRSQVTIPGDRAAVSVDVSLASSGTVTGRFLKADGVTLIGGGQIRLWRGGQVYAYATSSSDPATLGSYQMQYVPLGDFTVDGYDPVTERSGSSGGRLTNNGDSASADIVVVPRGTVKGSVLNYSGTSPVAGASLNISVSGASNFSYSTVSAADGSYQFTGVPSGQFTVKATDPGDGLSGQNSGSLSYEGQVAQADVHIAPSGSLTGRVLMPDGSTTAQNATVSIPGVGSVQIDQTGSYQFQNLAAGASYTLNAQEVGTLRAGSAIATITSDGQVAVTDITLRGLGTVAGTIFDTDGHTPLVGAKITFNSSKVNYTVYSGGDGGYSIANVPAGSFSLQVSHPERVTGASASGSLGKEGETVTVNLTIGPVASVTGSVLMADGVTPSRGGGVSFTSGGATFTGVTDSNGVFVFASIPVPRSFSLYMEDPQGLGIARYSGSLTDNGQTLDLGSIVLDDKPITIGGSDPVAGAVNVPVGAKVKVVFTDPADPSTVSSSSVYLLQGNSRVSGTLALDPDNKGVTFTPAAPLNGFALYTLVVTTDVRDHVGRPLPQLYTASFTTIDNIPPTTQSISPANSTIQVATDSVVRVTFSESIDPATTAGITLMQGGSPVPVQLDLIQGGTVAVLTPLSPLSANATYTVSVSGVKDTVGNLMQGSTLSSFNTIDTIVPTITSLSVPANADLITGNSVPVTAQVADTDVAFVDFYANDVYTASVKSAPFTLPLTMPAAGPLHLKAVAQDKVGNRGVPAVLDLTVAADTPPTVAISSPADGSSVNTGAPFTVTLQGNDDLGVKSFTVLLSGEMSGSQAVAVTAAKSASATFTFIAPAAITQQGTILVTATARDTGGALSQPVQRTLTLHDNIAPAISLTSPGRTVQYKPGETAVVNISGTDNVGVVKIACSAMGAATGVQNFDLGAGAASTSQSFSFPIPADAPPYGSVNVTCTASDAAGNSKSSTLYLTVADVIPPTIVSTVPANGASNIPGNASITVNFSETVNAATVNSTTITLSESASGRPVPASVTLSADRKSTTLKPSAPLKAATGYAISVSSALADDAGNLLATPYQASFSTDSTPPQVVSVTPAADSTAVPPGVVLTVRFSEQVDPSSVAGDQLSLVTSGVAIPGTVGVAADGLSLSFKPLNQLALARLYTMTLKAGVRDITGNAIAADLASSFTTQGPDSDLVGYWPMDGDWNDYSGQGHNGTPVNGPLFTTDHMVGAGTQAGSFHGGGDYVSVGNLYGNFPNNTFSIESWVKLDDTGNGARRTIAGGTGSSSDYAIGLYNNQFTAFTYNKSSGFYASSGFTPQLGTWYHVAGTFDGSRLKLYVNGQLQSDIAAGWVQNNGGVDFWIGQEYCCGNNFNGLIDEVSLYKRALAPEDVLEHYNAGLTSGRTSPNPPTVEPVPGSTYVNQVVLRGTKDIGTSIRVNGKQVVDHDSNTSWQALYPLAVGENMLDITSRDIAGNASVAVSVAVNLLPGAPTLTPPTVALSSPGQSVRYNPGDSGTATVTATSADGITMLYCNAAGGVSQGSAEIPIDPPQTSVTQDIAFTLAPGDAPSAPVHVSCIARTTTGALALGTVDMLAADQVAPLASITSPAAGSTVNTGSGFAVTVQASDESELKSVTLSVSGEMTYTETRSTTTGNAFSTTFSLTAPQRISGDGNIVLTVTATDGAGNLSQAATRTLVLHDSIPPTITLTSPGQASYYRPGDTATVNVSVADNMGATQVVCNAYGAATASQTFNQAPQPGENLVFTFGVPVNALPYATMTASCTAYDAANNSSSASLNLTVADIVPPAVTGASVADNSANVPINAAITVNFSETVKAATVGTASVTLVRSDTGASIPASVTLSSDRKSVTLKPSAVLSRGVGYLLTASTAITDDAGNAMVAPYQLHFSCDSTPPAVALVSPAAGSVNVPVGSAVSVSFSEPIDPASVTSGTLTLTSVNGTVPGTVSVSSDGLSITFKPYNQLGYSCLYTLTLGAGVRDVSGNATASGVTASFTTQAADSDLVGYWPMDGDWTDYSGNRNNGSASSGATFSSDRVLGTQAASFDGVGGYVNIPNASAFNSGIGTWEFWVKIPAASSGNGFMLMNKADSSGSCNGVNIVEYRGRLGLQIKANCNGLVSTDGGVIADNKYHHVATVFTAGGSYSLYVDGVVISSGSLGSFTMSSQPVRIGKALDTYWQALNGLIDNVAMYNKALSPGDIFEHYNAGLNSNRTPPASPTLDAIPSSTFNNQIVLRGTKDAGADIRVNGNEIVAHDENTTWQAIYQLNLGQNLLAVTSHDLEGNVSPEVDLVVNLQPRTQSDPTIAALWHMDGDWRDYSGNGNDLTATNGPWTSSDSSLPGSSAGFNGSGAYLRRGNGIALPLGSSPRTFMAWIKPSSYPDSTYNGIFAYGQMSCTGHGSLLSIKNDGRLSSAFWCDDAFQTTGPVAPLNTWSHVAVTYDGGTKMSFYMNGQWVQDSNVSTPANTLDGAVRIGSTDDYGRGFNGLIDEVAVYGRALTPQEISTWYSSSSIVTIASPGQTVKYKPGDTGTATVTATNPNGITKLYCNASGAVSQGTLVIPFDTPQTSVTEQFTFQVAADAGQYQPYRLSCIAQTASGSIGFANLDLQAADVVPATVAGTSIANNATGVVATLPITVTFNEAMAPGNLTSGTVKLIRMDTGAEVAGTVTLSADGKTLTFTPAVALNCSTTYQLVLQNVTDLAGNDTSYTLNFSTQTLTSPLIQNQGSSSSPYTLAAGRYGTISITNSYVLFAGPVAADSLTLSSNSTVTHPTTGTTGIQPVNLTVSGLVSIDATSKIDVSSKGYLGAYRGGNSSGTGMTLGNTTTGGSSSSYGGGSYGGMGGSFDGNVNAAYGSASQPGEVGSGGGSPNGSSYPGGSGGGLVKVTAGTLTVNGSILADGGTGYNSGGGSGGGILLTVGTLSGSGTIAARGGAATNSSSMGSGGGGRIAIYYDTNSLPTANILANGGKSYDGSNSAYNGGAGTIYLKDNAKANPDLIVYNGGIVSSNTTPVSGAAYGLVDVRGGASMTVTGNLSPGQDMTITGSQLTLSGGLTAPGNLTLDGSSVTVSGAVSVAGTLTLKNQSVLSHHAVTTAAIYKLDVTASAVTVDATSKIDASSKGYLGAYRGGNGSGTGMTFGNTTTGGSSSSYGGGSYGGMGGSFDGNVNAAYGSASQPGEVGSGGGSPNGSSYPGGSGGGLVKVTAGTLTVNGSILADGGTGYNSGGGSGGGILLTVGTLSGSGTIAARGGAATNSSSMGSGGGGRIAIYYDTNSLPTANILANGGKSYDGSNSAYNGGAGTIYLKDNAKANPDLIVYNGGIVSSNTTPVSGAAYGLVDVRGGASMTVTGNLSPGQDMTITGSQLTLSGGLTAPGNLTLDGSSVTVSGAVSVAGTLTLKNQSVLSHHAVTTAAIYKLDVTASAVTVDATSKIDASSKGYLGAYRGGNGSGTGMTFGNTTTGGSTSYAGGSYGGMGGSGGNVNAAYGNASQPGELGSGGGTPNGSSYPGGSGGGLMKVTAGTLTVNGSILADGGTGYNSGGGSGGGILLTVGTLSGSGTIAARGGAATNSSTMGSGGGGRIAIYYDTNSLPTSNILANGGKSYDGSNSAYSGGAGTIYLKDNAKANPDLYINNGGIVSSNTTAVPGGVYGLMDVRGGVSLVMTGNLTPQLALSTLTLDNSSMSVSGAVNVAGTLTLQNQSVMLHYATTTTAAYKLDVTASTLTIDSTSKMDASSKGYLGAYRGANNSGTGMTFGNTTTGGSTSYAGGSYGGPGGSGGNVNAGYGSASQPGELGSGGGTPNSSSYPGGSGGGLVKVTAGTLTVNGSILADGGTGYNSGGGSGGGILLTVGTLSGSGTIVARGGAATNSSAMGSGGGGRIAIYYAINTLPTANILANGGKSYDGSNAAYNGGAGTIYLKDNAKTNAVVIINNGGINSSNATVLPSGSFDNIIVSGGAVISMNGTYSMDRDLVLTNTQMNISGVLTVPNLTMNNSTLTFNGTLNVVGNLSMQNNSMIAHAGTTTTSSSMLSITAGTFTVDATSRIDVSGRGYLGAYQGSNSSNNGRTNGNTTTGGSTSYSGGGYGGNGGIYSSGTANAPYGDPLNPNEVGSGGAGDSNQPGGNGGGLVRILAATLQLDGTITADGQSAPSGYYGGGGSGGGVRIDAGTLSGAGYVYSRGGSSPNNRGGGGGGRIAVYYGSMNLPQANLVASGASTSYAGGAGTVYLKCTTDGTDQLVIDNRGVDGGEGSTLFRSLGTGVVIAVTPDTLTTTGVNWQPGSLKGMRFAPDASQARYFTVIDNDATNLHIDPTQGDLTQATSPGLTFSGVYPFSRVSVLGKARVTTFDPIAVTDELVVDNSTLVPIAVSGNKLTVRNGGLLTQWRTTTSQGYGVNVSIGTLSIDATSKIDVSGRGYLGAYQGGNNYNNGRTFGNTTNGGSTNYSGGGYGGYGGSYSSGVLNALYGDPANPNEVGSGGAGDSNQPGGNGGGLVRVTAGIVQLDGSIIADGQNAPSGYYGGGGSGGGILVDAGTLSGSGYIYSRGGSSPNSRGGGGGGRIAVHYGTMTMPQSNLVASGSATGYQGGAGTIYLKADTAVNGDLVVSAAGSKDKVTELPAGDYGTVSVTGSTMVTDGPVTAATIVLNNAVLQSTVLTADTVTLTNGSTLTHPAATTSTVSSLSLAVSGTLTVDATSKIDASSRGYLGAYQGGNSSNNGRTFGNTTNGGSTNYSGGGYGGYGGTYSTGVVNALYGDLFNPNEVGSGGAGDNNSLGGNGGGLIRVQAGTLQLDGSIIADGQTSPSFGGGGSGGGVRVDAGTLSGAGFIYSRGGGSPNVRGNGGGGRIAVYYGTMTLPQSNVVATGASTGAYNGGAGTTYFKCIADGSDQLVVDGRGTDAGEGSTVLRSLGSGVVSGVTPSTLTTTGVNWQPGSLKGMRFYPDANQSIYFTVVDNDAASLHIDPTQGDLTQATAPGSTYSGVYPFSKISVLGKARLTGYDRFAVSDELVVDGSTLVAADVSANKLTIRNGGVLTQWRTTTSQVYGLAVASSTVSIDLTSRIDVTGRGYLGAYQGGNTSNNGRTNGNTTTGGSSNYSGGSYGGLGGRYSTGTVNALYGDPTNPNDVGSGGAGDNNSLGGSGGGLLRIQATTLQVDGSIVADGQTSPSFGGAGSGGAIRIDSASLSGAGYIYARGGNSPNARGGGGGGRIAIYTGAITLPQTNVVVTGGSVNGNAGTVQIHLQ